jgi:hypothetical protein
MLNLRFRTRSVGTFGVVAALLLVGACDVKEELLSPQNPTVIDPSAVNNPGAANALRVGALGAMRSNTGGNGGNETAWLMGGLLTDEWKSADTFLQRNETDQRKMQTNNSSIQGVYGGLQQARGYIRDAITAMNAYLPAQTAQIGELYFSLGIIELTLAENFCNGIPIGYAVDGVVSYTPSLTNVQVIALAVAHFDTALAMTTATDAATVAIRNATLIAKARTQVDLAQFAAAATMVSGIATSYQYLMTFTATTGGNGTWDLNWNRGGYSLADSFDTSGLIRNAIPFISSNDPRLPVLNPRKAGQDGQTPLIEQNFVQRYDPVPLVSGIDARLIEAEAKLQANDIAGMMTILNALRTTSQTIGIFKVPVMTALPTPADKTAATNLLFREKAFWQFSRGYRLNDLRRLIRQYGRTQDAVFPTGNFFKGTTYGIDVNLPVTDNEKTNPLFTGCIDRNA